MDSLRPLILVHREGMRQSLVGIFATENVFVLARMPNAILAGQRLRTDVPIDVQLAETQDRIGAMPDHSAKEIYHIIMIMIIQFPVISLGLPTGVGVGDLPAILVDLALDGEVSFLREEIVAWIARDVGDLDGVIDAIFLVGLRLYKSEIGANGMPIEEHARIQG